MKRKTRKSAFLRTKKLAVLFSMIIAASSGYAEVIDLETSELNSKPISIRLRDEEKESLQPIDVIPSDFNDDESFVQTIQFAQGPSPAPGPTAPQAPGAAPNAFPGAANSPFGNLPAPTGGLGNQSLSAGGAAAALGATSASYSAAPNMIGDIFGGGFSSFSGSQTVTFNNHVPGFILSGSPGTSSSLLGFEYGNDSVPNDVFTQGLGTDASGDGQADTFSISEPLPPNDAPTAPGPGFVFNGGTAVYTNNNTSTTAQNGIYQDNQLWYVSYSYTGSLNGNGNGLGGVRSVIPVPGPGVAARRVKISENFSPEVRDRVFFNYSFFNNAYGNLGDISRYIIGSERILMEDLVSFEARLPLAGTYGSFQAVDQPESRNFELGNASFISKVVLLRRQNLLFSGGMGFTIPSADDTVLTNGNREIVRIENETFHLLPFLAAQLRLTRKTVFQTYLQLDVAANGDPVLANLTGGPLPNIGKFNDSTLLHADVAMNRQIYQGGQGNFLRAVLASGELHYTGTLQSSDIVANNGFTYQNLQPNFDIVNSTFGLHMLLGKKLVATPAISIPFSTGLNRQFDYEAIIQLNYLR